MSPLRSAFLVLSLWFAFALPAQGESARAWQATIELPTYALGEEDPDPAFPLASRHRVYPYTMLDDLTDRLETKTYRALYLENEFLKATVLPGLGGRLYSLYDKRNKREVFYRNNVVKYGLVALRGAWISGGIEFNFPDGHTVVTVSSVSSTFHQNRDGSATVVVGDIDQVTGMHWEVALTLRPGEARLEQAVKLFNPTPQSNLYWYWANAAVPATDDMQFIYPMREAFPHVHGLVWNYPVQDGVDYSWYKNIRQPTSLFGRQVYRTFFGAYYHQSDYGVVHVADYRLVPGKKVWSWGVAGDGLIWTGLLTDHDGPYNEIQSGRYPTQLNYEFMPPRQAESWTEYWYPVRGLGGAWVEASEHGAVNVSFLEASADSKPRVRFVFSPTVATAGAKIRVKLGSRVLREVSPVSFEPMQLQQIEVPVEDLQAARKAIALEVDASDGRNLLHWSAADPVDGNPDFVPAVGAPARPPKPESKMTVEELFLRGVEEEKEGREEAAEKTYGAVLERDAGYIPALLKQAWKSYQGGDFAGAEAWVARAMARDSLDPRVHYAAGVIYRTAGRLTLAKDAFWAVIQYGAPPAPAFAQLVEISLQQKEFDEALGLLHKALQFNPDDALMQTEVAVAMRLAGKSSDAGRNVALALGIMPLLPYAAAEQWIQKQASKSPSASPGGAEKAGPAFTRHDLQDFLDVAAWYLSLNDAASAGAVLHAALEKFPREAVSPLVFYYLAAVEQRLGHKDQAETYLSDAAKAPYEKVFPSRLADAEVLDEALRLDPLDAHAKYFLGNFLFAHGRYDDAAQLWALALGEGFESSVLMRNLGLYAWRAKKDLVGASGFYQSAVRLAPENYRLYVDLDEIYFALNNLAARQKLFAQAPAGVRNRDTVRLRLALLEAQQKHYDQALDLLMNHAFKPWEGGEIVRQVFVFANLQKGRQALEARKFEEAEKAFRRALDYPANLGVGRPDKPRDEEAQYWLGESLSGEGRTEEARAAWREAAAEGETRRIGEGSEGREGLAGLFRGLALRRLGENVESDKLLKAVAEAAEQERPSGADLYASGLLNLFENRRDQAKSDLKRAVDADSALWQARIELEQLSAP